MKPADELRLRKNLIHELRADRLCDLLASAAGDPRGFDMSFRILDENSLKLLGKDHHGIAHDPCILLEKKLLRTIE